ncbi:hypothetical protein [Enterocloster bolteae]|uniref:hypothetical protein n=1 Tax=Enterocloster bolteae TaxID=208479 RepID=UPI00210BDD46|nr:hypothetical protein [Enterocloster bolteae]MCQ5144329.1 hypothetical protein [Enterocloster bolteae]
MLTIILVIITGMIWWFDLMKISLLIQVSTYGEPVTETQSEPATEKAMSQWEQIQWMLDEGLLGGEN